jgi:hypothetical protein
VITLVFVLFRSAPVPNIVLLPANASLVPKGVAFDKWVPMSWAWYWRTKDFVLGHSRTVLIEATFFSISPKPELPMSFPQPVKSITNLDIYFVPTNESGEIGVGWTWTLWKGHTASCRIATADGIQARVFSVSDQDDDQSFGDLSEAYDVRSANVFRPGRCSP